MIGRAVPYLIERSQANERSLPQYRHGILEALVNLAMAANAAARMAMWEMVVYLTKCVRVFGL